MLVENKYTAVITAFENQNEKKYSNDFEPCFTEFLQSTNRKELEKCIRMRIKKFQAIQRWMCSRKEITSGFLCFISFKVSPIQARAVSQFKLPLGCVCVHIFLAVSLEPGRSFFSFLLDREPAEIMSSSNTYKVLRAIEKERVETTLDEGFGAGWQSSE
jgi:hypothetical protein